MNYTNILKNLPLYLFYGLVLFISLILAGILIAARFLIEMNNKLIKWIVSKFRPIKKDK